MDNARHVEMRFSPEIWAFARHHELFKAIRQHVAPPLDISAASSACALIFASARGFLSSVISHCEKFSLVDRAA